MPITINGSGSVVGLTAGGLPDASVVTADIADANITAAKLSGAQTGTAPIYGCRAWVNFDGTRNAADTGASTNGANVKIRASGNVSSVLKNGVGDYTVNFTTAMVDANYCTLATTRANTGANAAIYTGISVSDTGLTSSVRIAVELSQTGSFDRDLVNVAIFR